MNTTERQLAGIIADLVDRGGGTYEATTLLPFTPSNGYAVGVGGLHLPVHLVDKDGALWAIKAVAGEYGESFVGTWLHNGLVYFDAVRYFANGMAQEATDFAVERGQQAIYDFASGETMYMPARPALEE